MKIQNHKENNLYVFYTYDLRLEPDFVVNVFHNYQEQITMPNIFIDNVAIECVPNFNFSGVHYNKNLSWKPHITHISNLITKSVGVLNRLKNILPTSIKLMIYNALILFRINYGILALRYNSEKNFKLQKSCSLNYSS